MSTCSSEWSTEFSDTFYGLSARCELPADHSGKHAGTVRTWDGDSERVEPDVRLEWPNSYEIKIEAGTITPDMLVESEFTADDNGQLISRIKDPNTAR